MTRDRLSRNCGDNNFDGERIGFTESDWLRLRKLSKLNARRAERLQSANLISRMRVRDEHLVGSGHDGEQAMSHWYLKGEQDYRPVWKYGYEPSCDYENSKRVWHIDDDYAPENRISFSDYDRQYLIGADKVKNYLPQPDNKPQIMLTNQTSRCLLPGPTSDNPAPPESSISCEPGSAGGPEGRHRGGFATIPDYRFEIGFLSGMQSGVDAGADAEMNETCIQSHCSSVPALMDAASTRTKARLRHDRKHRSRLPAGLRRKAGEWRRQYLSTIGKLAS